MGSVTRVRATPQTETYLVTFYKMCSFGPFRKKVTSFCANYTKCIVLGHFKKKQVTLEAKTSGHTTAKLNIGQLKKFFSLGPLNEPICALAVPK